jgi:hypothetical protein
MPLQMDRRHGTGFILLFLFNDNSLRYLDLNDQGIDGIKTDLREIGWGCVCVCGVD